MNKKVQARKLTEAIRKLQSARALIKTKRLSHAKQQIQDAVSSCGYIVYKSRNKKYQA
ncbi:hypothetical protein [Paenibacillus sinopodophylli]|uniref:hypothetical protein n=1 Tax=Paenibacillus sinopodophylli TaxID=1837342 RepID=UPI00148676C6|nr:hypothetical protein [Paenibacillus sinopodophylli]